MLYTQANNHRGIAAASDALGDLYMIQGQYKVALEHFRKLINRSRLPRRRIKTAPPAPTLPRVLPARRQVRRRKPQREPLDNGFNANLMLAKIGDTNFRLGNMSKAGTAYS